MKPLGTFPGGVVEPILGAGRSYRIETVSGVTPHFMASRGVLLLHLPADTGDKLRVREEFLPVRDIVVHIRVPQGRPVKSASLRRTAQSLPEAVRGGWLDGAVPRILIHAAVKVDLA